MFNLLKSSDENVSCVGVIKISWFPLHVRGINYREKTSVPVSGIGQMVTLNTSIGVGPEFHNRASLIVLVSYIIPVFSNGSCGQAHFGSDQKQRRSHTHTQPA